MEETTTNLAARFVFVDTSENFLLYTSDLSEILRRISPTNKIRCFQPKANIEIAGKEYEITKIMIDYFDDFQKAIGNYNYHEGNHNLFNLDIWVVVSPK